MSVIIVIPSKAQLKQCIKANENVLGNYIRGLGSKYKACFTRIVQSLREDLEDESIVMDAAVVALYTAINGESNFGTYLGGKDFHGGVDLVTYSLAYYITKIVSVPNKAL